MHDHRYGGGIERLRSQSRLELLEIERVADLCLQGIDVKTMLDAGTGSGVFAEAYSRRGIRVTGIDPNPEMLIEAGKYVPDAEFIDGVIEALPFKDGEFDFIFLGHVLHESDDIDAALAESRRCAKRRVCILEWPYLPEADGPPLEHRLKADDIIVAAARAGYSGMKKIPLNHMVLIVLDLQRTHDFR